MVYFEWDFSDGKIRDKTSLRVKDDAFGEPRSGIA
jgi:hypothetical protein